MMYILFMSTEQLAFTLRSSFFLAVIGHERFQKWTRICEVEVVKFRGRCLVHHCWQHRLVELAT